MRRIRTARRPKRSLPHRERPLPAPGGVYLPNSAQLAYLIASKGATDDEIESVYGLGSGTIKKWRTVYPTLDKAIETGRTKADGEVLHSLFKTATGYHYEEEQAVGGKQPVTLKVRRWYPGQFLAQRHWLANRQRHDWPSRDKVEFSGPDGNPIRMESRNDLMDAIVALIASKIDPEKEKTDK